MEQGAVVSIPRSAVDQIALMVTRGRIFVPVVDVREDPDGSMRVTYVAASETAVLGRSVVPVFSDASLAAAAGFPRLSLAAPSIDEFVSGVKTPVVIVLDPGSPHSCVLGVEDFVKIAAWVIKSSQTRIERGWDPDNRDLVDEA